MQIHILTSAHMNLSTYIINNYRRMRNFQNFPLDESHQELKCEKNYISLNHYRVTQRAKMQKNLVLTRSQQHHRKRNKGWPASSPKTEKRSASKITENRTKVGQQNQRPNECQVIEDLLRIPIAILELLKFKKGSCQNFA